MDSNQNKIIELMREVHLIAFKEIERLKLRIAELESLNRAPIEKPMLRWLASVFVGDRRSLPSTLWREWLIVRRLFSRSRSVS